MNPLLIKSPHITEKTVDISKYDKYVFVVDKNANSSEIKKAVEKIYSVNVVKVNIVNLPKKQKRFGNKFSAKGGVKKIIVTLKKGQKIDILPQ